MSRWDKIPEAMQTAIRGMTPTEICEFISKTVDKIETAETIVSSRKAMRDFAQFAAADIFEKEDIKGLKTADGKSFNRNIETRCSAPKADRDAFCRKPPEAFAEARAFVKESVNASTFNAWCARLVKDGKPVPSFVTTTHLAVVRSRKS